jgi:hypothetical protein
LKLKSSQFSILLVVRDKVKIEFIQYLLPVGAGPSSKDDQDGYHICRKALLSAPSQGCPFVKYTSFILLFKKLGHPQLLDFPSERNNLLPQVAQ